MAPPPPEKITRCVYAVHVCAGVCTGEQPATYSHHIQRGGVPEQKRTYSTRTFGKRTWRERTWKAQSASASRQHSAQSRLAQRDPAEPSYRVRWLMAPAVPSAPPRTWARTEQLRPLGGTGNGIPERRALRGSQRGHLIGFPSLLTLPPSGPVGKDRHARVLGPCPYAARVCVGIRNGEYPITYSHHIHPPRLEQRATPSGGGG